MNREDLLKAIEDKYGAIGEDPNTYLEGLLHANLITYWDYVEVDTLLSLQKPRTTFADEEIFIIYHQVTELVLKLIMHEVKQITGEANPSVEVLTNKVNRINRYTTLLVNSFSIMRDGMSYDDYNLFRKTLTPASGFQSAQFRFIELRCTRVQNLINASGKARLPENPTLDDYFENIYWKDAGLDRKTGKKTLTLKMFEDKYEKDFKALAIEMEGNTLEEKINALGDEVTPELKDAIRQLDVFYNIEWPMTHLRTARHYLNSKGENQAATGGSEWQKYLHPMYQQRKFFPSVWSAEEL
ncbi:MAG: tryptophan 2,3-dioxygenase, partial [Bacteroidetes bacterium]|nr:tryptophan 2,3-dioxygenase [Bacteroidota bacterium]